LARRFGEELFPTDGKRTLSTFYRDWYVPMRLSDASQRTKEGMELALRFWARLTGDPALSEITPATLVKYRDCLATLDRVNRPGKLSTQTVGTRLRHIQVLLNKAGPPGYRNRDAAGFIVGPVPWIKPPRMVLPPPKNVSLDYLSKLYLAAGDVTSPLGIEFGAATWWRTFLVMAYCTGLRRRTLFELRMEWIDWDACTLTVPPRSMKSGRWHVAHLNPTAMEHLRAIRTDRELVFPWPCGPRHFDKLFDRLQHRAGIPLKERFGLHVIRKTVATQLWATSPQASQLALGHAGSAVTMRHYVQAKGIVAEALDRLPQPEAFKGVRLHDGPDRPDIRENLT
jgi:integrase